LKRTLYIALFFIAICYAQELQGQEKAIDSLKVIVKNAKHDSIRINALKTWDNLIYMSDPKTDVELTKRIDALTNKNLRKKLNKKEKRYFLSAKIFSLNSLGLICFDQGNYAKAMTYYTQSLKLCDRLHDTLRTASIFNNIGLLYQNQNHMDKALEYFVRSLRIREASGDSVFISESLNNIANIYERKGDYEGALKLNERALKIKEKSGNKSSVSTSFNNIGHIYQMEAKYAKALEYFNACLKIKTELNEPWGISVSYYNIAQAYLWLGNYEKAVQNCKKSLSYATSGGFIIEKRNALQTLYDLYKKTGRYKEAFESFTLGIAASDSINKEENQKEVVRQEIKYQYEKQAIADNIKHAREGKVKDALLATQKAQTDELNAELKNKRILQYAMISGLILLLVFTGFVYNRFRLAKKQKEIIEIKEKEASLQKELIEEKQKEIIGSIQYAKRIQNALLPNEKQIAKTIQKLKA
jgi:tetratricopeptide (TPR) repeat protein